MHRVRAPPHAVKAADGIVPDRYSIPYVRLFSASPPPASWRLAWTGPADPESPLLCPPRTVLCPGEWLIRIASHRNAGASGIHHTTDAGSNVHAGLEASRRVPPRDLLGRQAAEVRAHLGECSVPSTVFSYV